MSRRSKPPVWPRVALAAAAALLLIAALAGLSRLILGVMNGLHHRGGEADPMFAQPAEVVTRPPDLMEGTGLSRQEADPSSKWVSEYDTPVDKTAEELAREETP